MKNNDFNLRIDFSKELKLILMLLKKDWTYFNNHAYMFEIDWDFFLQLTIHHRLYPSIYKKLKSIENIQIPSFVIKNLRCMYERNTFQMLQLSSVMDQVNKCFRENGIYTLFLKGPVLAVDLYNDLSMRTSKDLDILIKIEDLEKVNQLLLDQGYEKDQYIRTVLDDWKWKNHHVEYYHPKKGICLEIHWKMNPGTGKEPSFKELWNRKRKSPTHHQLPVYFLGREDLYVYLITHGARHGWFRLRWLTDLDQMSKQELDWNQVSYLCKKYHCQHLAGQAHILASTLLCSQISKEMKEFNDIKKSSILAQSGLYFINQIENLHNEDLSDKISNKFNAYLYSLMTFQQKCVSYLGYFFPVPEDAEVLPLPKKFHFLYFPLRPFIWVWRKSKRQTV